MKKKSVRDKLEFFERQPSLTEIQRCWAVASFRGEVERAITNHPEWSYVIEQGEIWESEVAPILAAPTVALESAAGKL